MKCSSESILYFKWSCLNTKTRRWHPIQFGYTRPLKPTKERIFRMVPSICHKIQPPRMSKKIRRLTMYRRKLTSIIHNTSVRTCTAQWTRSFSIIKTNQLMQYRQTCPLFWDPYRTHTVWAEHIILVWILMVRDEVSNHWAHEGLNQSLRIFSWIPF